MNTNFEINKIISALTLSAILGGVIISNASAADIAALTENCTDCHGKDGTSTESSVPTIAGVSETYIVDSMAIYKDKERPCIESEFLAGSNKGKKTDMCKIAAELGDEDVAALAKFYAGKTFVPAKQDFDAAKAALGQKIHDSNCEKCHADGGKSAEDDAGILAGQWRHYLELTFKSYDSGERAMPKKMKPKYEKLNATDIENLVNYYVSLQ